MSPRPAFRPASTRRAKKSPSRRPSITTWADCGPTRAEKPPCPACGRRAKPPRPACMAPIASPPIRCWKRWCSATASPATSQRSFRRPCPSPRSQSPTFPRRSFGATPEAAAEVRKIMTRHVGVLRDAAGLSRALRSLLALRGPRAGDAKPRSAQPDRSRPPRRRQRLAAAREPGRPFPLRLPGGRPGAGA